MPAADGRPWVARLSFWAGSTTSEVVQPTQKINRLEGPDRPDYQDGPYAWAAGGPHPGSTAYDTVEPSSAR